MRFCNLSPRQGLACPCQSSNFVSWCLLMIMLVMGSGAAWADTYKWSHGGTGNTLEVTAAKGATEATAYTGYSISYGGETYTSAIKMESATTLTFATTKKANITVGVALKDGTTYNNASTTALTLTTGENDPITNNTGIIISTTGAKVENGLEVVFSNVPAGTQVIKRAGSEEGVFYIKVEDVIETFTVNYNGNYNTSGSVPVDPNSPYTSGSWVTVLGNTGNLEKTGYTFTSWRLGSKDQGNLYSGGQSFQINKNYTLYAQWAANNYTITYDATTNGGECSTASQTYTYDGAALEMPTATKAGKEFAGWFTASSGGELITNIGTTYKPSSDITLYAQFRNPTFNVKVQPNIADGGTTTVIVGEDDYTDAAASVAGASIPSGSNIVLTAIPNPGYKFNTSLDKPWGNSTSSKTNPTTFSNLNSPKTFSPQFIALNPPTITSQPSAETNYARGDAATPLNVTATASEEGSLSYQWYRNTTNSTSGGAIIVGEENNTYTPSTESNGITYYYCVVTENVDRKNSDGDKANGTTTTVSSVAKVTVKTNCDLEHKEPTIGNPDQTTPYRGARTEMFSLKEGDRKAFRFTNHGNPQENWHNWNVAIMSSTDLNTASDDMIFRADNFGWGNVFDNAHDSHSITMNGGVINWDTFKTDMNNANVEVVVDYNATTKQITVTATSSNGKYVETATSQATSGTKGVYFFVDQSHFTDFRELLTIKTTASDGCTLNSIVVGETPIADVHNNETYFVEPNSNIVITTSPKDNTMYLRNWNVTGTQGEASTSGSNEIYTINALTAHTTVIAKYGVKSNETLPHPDDSEYDENSSTFTLTAFGSDQAGKEQAIVLHLPEYATAVVKSGSEGRVESDKLFVTAPSQNSNGSTIIIVTAHDGTTNKEYAINYSTVAAPAYDYIVQAWSAGQEVHLGQIATGHASTATVAYPQYILSGNTLYNIPKAGDDPGWYRKRFNITTSQTAFDLIYNGSSVDKVVFYSEGENISGMTATASNANRASNGAAGYFTSNQEFLATTIHAGSYTISARGVNGNNDDRHAIFKAGDKQVFDFTITNKNNESYGTSKPFFVDHDTEIYVSCQGSSASGLDWFYIQKSDVLPVTENGQKFGCTQQIIDAAEYANFKTSKTQSGTYDGFTGDFVRVKNDKEFITVCETGAMGFVVKAFHGSSSTRTVDILVDDVSVGTLNVAGSLTASPIFAIDNTGTHTIKIQGPSGNGADVYIADIIFYTVKPTGGLTTSIVSTKVTSNKTTRLESNSGGAISMTTAASAVEEYAVVDFNASNELIITPKKAGSFTLDFSIAGTSTYDAGTSTVTVNIRKEQLTMTIAPEMYVWNKTTTHDQPTFRQPEVTLEDEGSHEVEGLTLNYSTDDASVATISGTTINLVEGANGSANIYIKFDGNDSYEPAYGVFTVLIEQGVSLKIDANTKFNDNKDKPSVTEEFILKDTDGTTPLVYATFGGWKYGITSGESSYVVDGSTKDDKWGKPSKYTGSGNTTPTYVDGYSYATSGNTDAMDESKLLSSENIFGKQRNGWFKSECTDLHVKPFTLPVRGAYMKFEPQKNGMLTVYLLQNGAFNTSQDENGKSVLKPGEFQPHSFHVVDQNGTAVPLYTDFQFVVKEPVTQLDVNGDKIICNYNDKKAIDYDNGLVPAGVQYLSNDVSTWPMFYSNFTKQERTDINNAWKSGNNDAQKVVKLHDASFFLTQKAYVKYTFYVAASQTYYIFSNFSKLGFAGMNFIADANQPDPDNDVLELNDEQDFPKLRDASKNVSTHLSIPQYGKITVNRSFTAGAWNTICLPFNMTEREVKENFGDGVELLCFDGTEEADRKFTLHFVYHEIQSILAGYPYLIKPSKDVTQIEVRNKIIQPANSGTPSSPVLDYTKPKEMITFATSRYYVNNPYRAEVNDEIYTFMGTSNYSTAAKQPFYNGDIYMSGGSLVRRKTDNDTPGAMKGYRAFLKCKEDDKDKYMSKSISVNFSAITDTEDEFITGIMELVEDEEITTVGRNIPQGVYNINGQKVNNDTRRLPSGLYIVNGKKLYIK